MSILWQPINGQDTQRNPFAIEKIADFGPVTNFVDAFLEGYSKSLNGFTVDASQYAYWDKQAQNEGSTVTEDEFTSSGASKFGLTWRPNLSHKTLYTMQSRAADAEMRAYETSSGNHGVASFLGSAFGGNAGPLDLAVNFMMPGAGLGKALATTTKFTISEASRIMAKSAAAATMQSIAELPFTTTEAKFAQRPISDEDILMNLVSAPLGGAIMAPGFHYLAYRAKPEVVKMATSQLYDLVIRGGEKSDAARAWLNIIGADGDVAQSALLSRDMLKLLRKDTWSQEDKNFFQNWVGEHRAIDLPSASGVSDKANAPVYSQLYAESTPASTEGQKMLSDVFNSLFGVEVRFHPELTSSGKIFPDKPGTIFIKGNGGFKEVATGAFHELTHSIRLRDPNAYRSLLDVFITQDKPEFNAAGEMLHDTFLKQATSEIKQRYGERWNSLSEDRKLDEAVAQAVGIAATTDRFWKTLYTRDRNTFSRFTEYLHRVFQGIRKALTGKDLEQWNSLFDSIARAVSLANPEAKERSLRWDAPEYPTEVFGKLKKRLQNDAVFAERSRKEIADIEDQLVPEYSDVQFPNGLGEWVPVPERTIKYDKPRIISDLETYRHAFLGKSPKGPWAKDHPVFYSEGKPIYRRGRNVVDEVRFFRHKGGNARVIERPAESAAPVDAGAFTEYTPSKFRSTSADYVSRAREAVVQFFSEENRNKLLSEGKWPEFLKSSKMSATSAANKSILSDDKAIAIAQKLGLVESEEEALGKYASTSMPVGSRAGEESLSGKWLNDRATSAMKAWRSRIEPIYVKSLEGDSSDFAKLSDDQVIEFALQTKYAGGYDPNKIFVGDPATEVPVSSDDPLFGVFSDPLDGYQDLARALGEDATLDMPKMPGWVDRQLKRLEEATGVHTKYIHGSDEQAILNMRASAASARALDSESILKSTFSDLDNRVLQYIERGPDKASESVNGKTVDPLDGIPDVQKAIATRGNSIREHNNSLVRSFIGDMGEVKAPIGPNSWQAFKAYCDSNPTLKELDTAVTVDARKLELFSAINRIALNSATPAETAARISSYFRSKANADIVAMTVNAKAVYNLQRVMSESKDPGKYLLTVLDGNVRQDDFSGTPLPDLKGAYVAQFRQPLLAVFAKYKGLYHTFFNNISSEQIVEHFLSGRTTELPQHLQELADTLSDIYETQRVALNQKGANIPARSDFAYSQNYNMTRARQPNKAQWMEDTGKAIDWDATWRAHGGVTAEGTPLFAGKTPEALEFSKKGYLEQLYDYVVGSKWREDLDPELNTGNEAAQASHVRNVVFQPKAFFEWDIKYGSGNPAMAFMRQISRRADKLAVMELFGATPKETFAKVSENVPEGLLSKISSMEDVFKQVTGELDTPVNEKIASVGANVRRVSNLINMGSSGLSALTDIPMAAATLRYYGIPMGVANQRIFELYKEALTGRSQKEVNIFLSSLGAGGTELMNSFSARMVGEPSNTGRISVLNDMMFFYNGLNKLTKAGQEVVVSRFSRGIAYGEVTPESVARYGLSKEDLETLAKYRHPVDGLDGARVSPEDVRADHPELAKTYAALLQHVMHEGVLEPDPSSQAFSRFGTKAGTVKGEAARVLLQYTSFPHAMLRKTWGRVINGYGDSFWKGFSDPRSKQTVETVVLLGTMLGMGYVLTNIKDILKGREPTAFGNDNSMETLKRVLSSSGIAGPLAGVMTGEVNPLGDMGSPFARSAINLGKAATGHGSVAKVVMNNLPGQSLPVFGEVEKNLLALVMGDAIIGLHSYNVARLRAIKTHTGSSGVFDAPEVSGETLTE